MVISDNRKNKLFLIGLLIGVPLVLLLVWASC